MSDDAVKQAADQARAVVTDMMLEDFAKDEQYAAVAAEHRANLGVAPPSAPVPVASAAQVESTEHVAATEAEAPAQSAAPAVPAFDLSEPELPDDILAFLNEPDFDAEAAAELAAEPGDESSDFDEEYTSEETQNERKRRVAAEKKAAWLEERLADSNRGKWQEEARKYFPYAEHALGEIKATSRRQFLREAQRTHEAMKPHLTAYLRAASAAIGSEAQVVLETTKRDQVEAWGNPTIDPASNVATDAAFQATVERSRREAPNLEAHFRTLLKASTTPQQ